MFGWQRDVCGHKWDASLDAWVGRKELAACSALYMQTSGRRRPSNQPSQGGSSLSWQSGTTRTMQLKGAFLMIQPCIPESRSCGFVLRVQKEEHSWAAAPENQTGKMSGCPCCADKVACRCNLRQLQTLVPRDCRRMGPEQEKWSAQRLHGWL